MLHQLRPLVRLNFKKFISSSNYNKQQQISCGKGGGGSSSLPEHLRKSQKLFQAKNNLPVFLKGGNTDKILYHTTLGLAALGLTLNVLFYASYIID